MSFNNSFSVADIIALASLLCVVGGGIFALHQWKKNSKIRREGYFSSLIELLNNDEFISVFHDIDYGNFYYDGKFHNKNRTNTEKQIDRLLYHLSYICYLKDNKLIDNKEFKKFEYFLNRACSNDQIIIYLFNLYHFTRKINCSFPYNDLLNYCKNHDFICNSFYADNCANYKKYLNF